MAAGGRHFQQRVAGACQVRQPGVAFHGQPKTLHARRVGAGGTVFQPDVHRPGGAAAAHVVQRDAAGHQVGVVGPFHPLHGVELRRRRHTVARKEVAAGQCQGRVVGACDENGGAGGRTAGERVHRVETRAQRGREALEHRVLQQVVGPGQQGLHGGQQLRVGLCTVEGGRIGGVGIDAVLQRDDLPVDPEAEAGERAVKQRPCCGLRVGRRGRAGVHQFQPQRRRVQALVAQRVEAQVDRHLGGDAGQHDFGVFGEAADCKVADAQADTGIQQLDAAQVGQRAGMNVQHRIRSDCLQWAHQHQRVHA